MEFDYLLDSEVSVNWTPVPKRGSNATCMMSVRGIRGGGEGWGGDNEF